jgi:hypothetical protein
MFKVQEIRKTCESSPAQWEGKTSDGKMIYVRYRWGELTIEISPELTTHIYDAIDGVEIFNKQIGDGYDGFLTYEQLKNVTAGIIEFPISEAT